ncbi:Myoneurin [Armadillidium vulgare]|nr:Myoneurin [Armadillidium vulgare]
MPRFCVICGKVQSHSFSVFSFPTSQKKRNAWLDVILKVKPDFLKDKRVVENKQLKNGVCELHFFQSEISNGKKRRLSKYAVPTLDIPASGKCFSTLRKYKTFLINESEDFPSLSALPYNSDNETIGSQISLVESKHKFSNDIVSLPDCTIEIEDKNSNPKIYKSIIDNIFYDENRKEVCLCCGSEDNAKALFSILKAKSPEGDHSLVEELSFIFEISQEKVISLGCFICRKCLKVIEDILTLKYTLSSLIAYMNKIFCNNNKKNNNNNEEVCNVNAEDSERLEKKLLTSCNNGIVRKSEKKKKDLSICKSCTKTFSSRAGLRYHEFSWHKKGKSLTCEICFKVFSYPMLYKNHKLFVHGRKNILCEICGEMFFTKSKLNIHVNAVHIKALTWSCDICNEKFTTSALYKHHVSSVKHMYCSAQFRKKSTIAQHMGKHGNYLCLKCNLKYTDTSSFVSHMLEIHNVDIFKKSNFKSQSSDFNSSEEILDTMNKVCDTSRKDDDSSVVINDILMASNEFENSTLQTLSFPASNRGREETSKYDELPSVEPVPFDNVVALEIQSVPNDAMELEEDVSLINVQMLQEIEHQHTNIK